MANYLFRSVNSRGKITLETRFYGISSDVACGIILGLSLGAKSRSRGAMYVVAYSVDDAGNITNMRALNSCPRNYFHPEKITL